jgi:hypothetical protein
MRASQTVVCRCGKSYAASVYKSVNVTRSPELREEITTNRLNLVVCPSCGYEQFVRTPFLYHDMDAALRVWVYPEDARSQSEEILTKIRRANEIAYSIIPTDASERQRAGPELVFGLVELRAVLAKLDLGGDQSPARDV